MNRYDVLDVDNVARIGLMFLDGDKFEDVLLDKYGHTDYDFNNFNGVKAVVMKIERLNPDLMLRAVLWQRRPDNDEVVVPLVAGSSFPLEGFRRVRINPEMRFVYETGGNGIKQRGDGIVSYYYAIRNSDNEIVGVLELLCGKRERMDV